MKLRSPVKFLLAALAAAAALVSSRATTIDFESFANNTAVSGPGVFADLEFSSAGRTIYAQAWNPGPDFGGAMSAGGDFNNFVGNPFRADFNIAGVSAVSVVMGDFNGDDDNLYLQAYDSSNNLLSSDTGFIDYTVYGGLTLNVSAGGNIAYVIFGSTGTFDNSVYFDNFTYTARESVPDTGMSAVLLGLGLLGLASMRRFTRLARA